MTAPAIRLNELFETAILDDSFMLEVAINLFKQKRITLARAARVADMTVLEFQNVIKALRIPVHYDVEQYEEDLQTLSKVFKS